MTLNTAARTTAVDIALRLPLPLDMSAVMIRLIGAAWPGAAIVPDDRFWEEKHLVIRVDPTGLVGFTPEDITAAVGEVEQGDGGDLTSFDPDDGLGISPPEHLTAILAPIALAIIDGDGTQPGAPNYMSWAVRRPDDPGRGATIVVQREDGASPHEKRMEAEARLDAVRALCLDRMQVDVVDVLRLIT